MGEEILVRGERAVLQAGARGGAAAGGVFHVGVAVDGAERGGGGVEAAGERGGGGLVAKGVGGFEGGMGVLLVGGTAGEFAGALGELLERGRIGNLHLFQGGEHRLGREQ